MIELRIDIPEFDHARFLSKISVSQDTDCWNFTGFDLSNGYAGFSINSRTYLAHRISYSIFKEKLVQGMYIDHICRNKKCCNPEHLRQVTPKINATENSFSVAVIALSKTHCPKGHAYDEKNTLITKLGRRKCKACQAIHWQNYKHRRKPRIWKKK